MAKHGKKYKAVQEKVEISRYYSPSEALTLTKKPATLF